MGWGKKRFRITTRRGAWPQHLQSTFIHNGLLSPLGLIPSPHRSIKIQPTPQPTHPPIPSLNNLHPVFARGKRNLSLWIMLQSWVSWFRNCKSLKESLRYCKGLVIWRRWRLRLLVIGYSNRDWNDEESGSGFSRNATRDIEACSHIQALSLKP